MIDYLLLVFGLIVIYMLFYALINSNFKKYNINQAVALVTGAGSGLGQQICFKLADENCCIICVDINESGNSDTVNQIKKKHPNCVLKSYICDVSNYDQVKQLVKDVLNEFKHVDILINNAGIVRGDIFENFTENQLRKIIDVNILGTFLLTSELLPFMKTRNQGCIVTISSLAGLIGVRHMIPYCATKFAVTGFMEGLKRELQYHNSNIRTVCVYPSFMETKMCKKISSNKKLLYMVEPGKVASDIINGIKNGISDIHPRKEILLGIKLLSLITFALNKFHAYIPLEDLIENTDIIDVNKNYKED